MTIAVHTSVPTRFERSTPSKRADVHIYRIDDEAILFDPRTSATFLLNPIALHVWRRCDGRTIIGRVLDELTERYDVERTTAKSHVQQVLTMYEDAGLVTEREGLD
jgi:PqqD family protein of HPr-rel-A system